MTNNNCPICRSADLALLKTGVRDSDQLDVIACNDCNHAFLSTFDHISGDYYAGGGIQQGRPFGNTIEQRLRHFAAENAGRLERLKPLLNSSRILDFGCGAGGFLELAAPLAAEVVGVEPNEEFRADLARRGFTAHPSLDQVDGAFDAIFAFHVLEHIPDPAIFVERLFRMLKPGGQVVVEVPHRNDALLSVLECQAYVEFYYFANHLHYFSARSLAILLERTTKGSGRVVVEQMCRFSLANHLHWLIKGKPGGHAKFRFLDSRELADAYGAKLISLGAGDTLLATIMHAEQRF